MQELRCSEELGTPSVVSGLEDGGSTRGAKRQGSGVWDGGMLMTAERPGLPQRTDDKWFSGISVVFLRRMWLRGVGQKGKRVRRFYVYLGRVV